MIIICVCFAGAVDGSVVTNLSQIEWNEVVPFAPRIGSTNNASSYLQWTVPLSGIQVSFVIEKIVVCAQSVTLLSFR